MKEKQTKTSRKIKTKNERKEKGNLKKGKGMKLIDNKKPIEVTRVW